MERAVINDDGTLGAFATVAGVALNTGRNYFTAVVTDHYLYILGGFDGVTGIGNVERAAIGADGSLGAFVVVSSLIEARAAHTNTVVGNVLYIVGGITAGCHIRSIERAIINSDGPLNAPDLVFGITAVRARHTATLVGNSLYSIGGETELTNGDTTVSLDVDRADIR